MNNFTSKLNRPLSRRRLLRTVAGACVAAVPGIAFAVGERWLRFHHTHTNEQLDVVYRDTDGVRPDALLQINELLRDHRNGETVTMDPALLDILS